MEKDFQDFIDQYMGNHLNEIIYDTVKDLQGEGVPFPLNEESASFIASVSVRTALALLRQYHAWIFQQREPD
jgi:hypothetical protein